MRKCSLRINLIPVADRPKSGVFRKFFNRSSKKASFSSSSEETPSVEKRAEQTQTKEQKKSLFSKTISFLFGSVEPGKERNTLSAIIRFGAISSLVYGGATALASGVVFLFGGSNAAAPFALNMVSSAITTAQTLFSLLSNPAITLSLSGLYVAIKVINYLRKPSEEKQVKINQLLKVEEQLSFLQQRFQELTESRELSVQDRVQFSKQED
ncbi:MAG: hypothetical protein PHU63_02845, partial [Candidatus ainarchaeum sp.]|nr:hypothetical protein [Candidatus ainarchaeum sp.]